jgi:hypothetical protein
MVTVACAEPEPLSVTCVGEMPHVEFVGAPLQESDTVPLYPLSEVSVSVYVPELFRATVSELGDTATEKSETACVNVDEVLPAKFALLDANTATTVWLPTPSELVENCAVPLESATDAAAVLLPSK